MNVYIKQAELKNAYIGEYKEGFEYSYDFIGKTTTQLANDGWITTRGTPVINSNGLYYGGSITDIVKSIGAKLANAKKITYTLTGRHGISGTADLDFTTVNWAGSGASYSNGTGVYNSYSSYNNYGKGGTAVNFTHTLSSAGPFAYTYVVDLEAKTVKLTYTLGSSSTFNNTLSNTEIANIRLTDYIRLAIGGSNESISTIKLLVE